MKFQINNKYYIRPLDEYNWIIAYMVAPEYKTALAKQKLREKGHKGEPKEKIYGYYPTLQSAKEDVVELIAKESDTIEELEKAVELIKVIAV